MSAADGVSVGDEVPVDGVADLSLERPERFRLRLALSDPTIEVDPPIGSGVSKLADRGHVQCVVELAVPSLGHAVGTDVSLPAPATRLHWEYLLAVLVR